MGNHDSYKVSGGLHGVGVSCVNALSKWLRLTVRREGKMHFIEFRKGIPQDRIVEQRDGFEVSPMKITGDTEKRGTEVHFQPDDEIFENIDFHYEILSKRLRELSFLNNGVKIRLVDERNNKEDNFAFAGGVKGFVEFINQGKKTLHPNIFHAVGEKLSEQQTNIGVEVAMQWKVVYADAAYFDRRFFWVVSDILGAHPAVDFNLRRAGKRKLATLFFLRQWKRLVIWPRSAIVRHIAWMKRYFGLKYIQCGTLMRVAQFVLLTYIAALAVALAAQRYQRPDMVRRRSMVLAQM